MKDDLAYSDLMHLSPTLTASWLIFISLCGSELLMAPHQHRMGPNRSLSGPLWSCLPRWLHWLRFLPLSTSLPFLNPHLPPCSFLRAFAPTLCFCLGGFLSRCYKGPSSFYSGLCWNVPSSERPSLTTWSEIGIHYSNFSPCFIFHHSVY